MTDCRGQFFAKRQEAKCDAVKEKCGYGLCKDSISDHCYGIDPALGYRAGQYEQQGNFTCLVEGSFCPLAYEGYYLDNFHM